MKFYKIKFSVSSVLEKQGAEGDRQKPKEVARRLQGVPPTADGRRGVGGNRVIA